MKTLLYACLACSALLLGACADMGGIHTQATQIDANDLEPGKLVEQAATAGGAEKNALALQWPQINWWQIYHDRQLNTLMTTALRDSPDLGVAQARVRQAEFYAGKAEAATELEITAKTSMTRQLFSEHDFIPPPEAGNYAWYNRAAVEASYDLDLWGKKRKALEAAIDITHAAAAEAEMARLALEHNIVRAYVQMSLQYALKDIAQETLAHREKALQVMHQRQSAGLATEMDVTQLEAALPPLHIQIERYDEAIEILRNQLVALSGQGPGAGDKLTRPILVLNSAAWWQLPTKLPAHLIGRRPDVVARRWSVQAAGKNIEAAKASFYPDINLMGFIGFQSVGFSKFLSNESAINGVGPAISLPIFDGAALRSNLGVQTAAYDIAVEQYNRTIVHAMESVANTLVAAKSLQKQKILNDSALNTASRARSLASQGFHAGMTDFLVLLNSEITLLTQRQQQAQLAAAMLESHATLMLALGGGYMPEDPDMADRANPSHTQNRPSQNHATPATNSILNSSVKPTANSNHDEERRLQ